MKIGRPYKKNHFLNIKIVVWRKKYVCFSNIELLHCFCEWQHTSMLLRRVTAYIIHWGKNLIENAMSLVKKNSHIQLRIMVIFAVQDSTRKTRKFSSNTSSSYCNIREKAFHSAATVSANVWNNNCPIKVSRTLRVFTKEIFYFYAIFLFFFIILAIELFERIWWAGGAEAEGALSPSSMERRRREKFGTWVNPDMPRTLQLVKGLKNRRAREIEWESEENRRNPFRCSKSFTFYLPPDIH